MGDGLKVKVAGLTIDVTVTAGTENTTSSVLLEEKGDSALVDTNKDETDDLLTIPDETIEDSIKEQLTEEEPMKEEPTSVDTSKDETDDFLTIPNETIEDSIKEEPVDFVKPPPF